MLRAVADEAAVVACNTCRHSAESRSDADGVTGGARLVAALHAAKAADTAGAGAFAGVEVQEMPCLFACADACTVHLRAPGKVGYVLGRFEADDSAARSILTYAALYAASDAGQVPYRQWPEGVKGHFITRSPPAGFVVE